MIGAYTGKGFAVVEVTGSREAFRERLIRELVRIPGTTYIAGLAGAMLKFAALQMLEEDAALPRPTRTPCRPAGPSGPISSS